MECGFYRRVKAKSKVIQLLGTSRLKISEWALRCVWVWGPAEGPVTSRYRSGNPTLPTTGTGKISQPLLSERIALFLLLLIINNGIKTWILRRHKCIAFMKVSSTKKFLTVWFISCASDLCHESSAVIISEPFSSGWLSQPAIEDPGCHTASDHIKLQEVPTQDSGIVPQPLKPLQVWGQNCQLKIYCFLVRNHCWSFIPDLPWPDYHF